MRIGIDLGTANSIVFVENKGVVLCEPTVVALTRDDLTVIAVGLEAKEMLGKTPDSIIARRPLRSGVIASARITEAILKYFFNKVLGRVRVTKPEVMISVPVGITSVEKRAVVKAAINAGAKNVHLIPEPLAAAIGAKLPIHTSTGNLIVNMGGGTTEIAVISLNGIVAFNSARVAGDLLSDSIATYIRKKHGLMIGEQMSEKVKIQIGSALPMEKPLEMEIRGRDNSTGLPRTIVVNSNEMVEAMKPRLNQIIMAIKSVLERTPPELTSDIIDRGLIMSGGTAMLRNLDMLFTRAIGVPSHIADDPMYCVAQGIGEALKHLDVLKRSLE
ncbi:MAG TPA: rod shape-determining protein [Candidatus Dojkabacteria bacterium]|nr:rod shape-determining protein [Candidatus Dojkabacteria bacterium]HQF37013.1 rod shape-determining protein [Candidatus Dojkabacteria bacterium]